MAAGTGIQYIGSGWPEVHALGRQSDRKIIAADVMTGMNGRSTQGIEFDTHLDLGTDETSSFYLSPSSNEVQQIFWRRHLSQPS